MILSAAKIERGKEYVTISGLTPAMEEKKLSMRFLELSTGVSTFIIWKAAKGRYVGKFLAECIIDGVNKAAPRNDYTFRGRPVCMSCGERCFPGFRRIKGGSICVNCQEKGE